MPKRSILIVTTSHDVIGSTGKPTGVWLEELATPYYTFRDAGAAVTIASIRGGKVPVDPSSTAGEPPESVTRFLADAEAQRAVATTPAIDAVDVASFDAVFLPGGHGTVWDLPGSAALARGLSAAYAAGKVVSAVCHGPAGLVAVTDASGAPLVRGKRVAGFTDSEEVAAGLDQTVPFLLESRLRELGGRYEKGADFQPFAVADGRLVTGQNPASSELVAKLVLEALG
jgi:putative intracellular protease/amidase